MRKHLFLFILLPFFAYSQAENPNNILKVSLSSLAYKAYTVHYEHVLGRKFSMGLGLSYRPKSSLRLPASFQTDLKNYTEKEQIISLSSVNVDDLRMGNMSVTPEIRYYFSKKEAPKGLYVSLFVKANYYDVNLPTTFLLPYKGYNIPTIYDVNFKINSYTGGLMLGYQAKLSKHFYTDLFVVGGGFGIIRLNSVNSQDLSILTADDKAVLRQRIYDTYKINDKYLNVTVDNSGININQVADIPAFSFRMLGVNLGYAF